MSVRYPELIKEIQLNSLAIYDQDDPKIDVVVKIKEIVSEIIVEYLKKTKYIKRQDLKSMEEKLREKLRERIKHKLQSVSCYWFGASPKFGDYYDITENFHINIRIVIKPEEGIILYVPTEVRYLYGSS